MNARVRRRGVIATALLATPALVVMACAPKSTASTKGEECFAAGDCAPGLVCVPQRSGARICTDDLSQVTGQPPAETGPPAEAGDATTDGPRPDASPDAPVDTGVDTGVRDAADAG